MFYHLEKGFCRIKIVHFVYAGPSHSCSSSPTSSSSRRESLLVRQAEKLAQIYFSISTSPSTLSAHSKYKFSHGFSFCLEATFMGFSLNDIFVLLQHLSIYLRGYYGSSLCFSFAKLDTANKCQQQQQSINTWVPCDEIYSVYSLDESFTSLSFPRIQIRNPFFT